MPLQATKRFLRHLVGKQHQRLLPFAFRFAQIQDDQPGKYGASGQDVQCLPLSLKVGAIQLICCAQAQRGNARRAERLPGRPGHRQAEQKPGVERPRQGEQTRHGQAM